MTVSVPFVEQFLPDVSRLAWCGNGQYIAIAIGQDIGIYNPSLKEIKRLEGHADTVYMVEWSPDRSRLASVSADGTLRIWEIFEVSAAYEPTIHTFTEGKATLSVAWSPDGTKLAYSVFQSIEWKRNSGFTTSVVKIWDVATQTVSRTLPPQVNAAPDLAWSPDSTKLATAEYVDPAYEVNIWDVGNGRLMAVYDDWSGIINALAWKPGADVLAIGSQNEGLAFLTSPAQEPSKLDFVTPLPTKAVYSAGWDPSGDRVAVAGDDKTIYLLDTRDQRLVETPSGHKNSVYQVRWSPDKGRLASVSADDVVRVWDISTLNH